MTKQALLEKINQLPLDERIRLVEDVWNGIAETPEAVPMPESHRRELDHRLDNPSSEPSSTWEEVRARLRNRG
jgi:putative addiction module component (TIGR02574 family)